MSAQLQGARILGIPVVVSEQYPKGLGSTVQEMDLTGAKLVFPKTKFSMVLPEVEAALAEIPGVRSVVLFGVEVSTCDDDSDQGHDMIEGAHTSWKFICKQNTVGFFDSGRS